MKYIIALTEEVDVQEKMLKAENNKIFKINANKAYSRFLKEDDNAYNANFV